MKARDWLLPAAFGLYWVGSLISMATMSIGAAVLLGALLVAFGPRGLWRGLHREVRERPDSRAYLWLAVALAATLVLSLIVALAAPLGYGGHFVEVSLPHDLEKLWYLFWPLPMVVGLRALGERGRRNALRAWLATFAVFSAIGIVQYYTGWPRAQPIPGVEHRFHAILLLGHHLSVASVFIFPFFACWDLAWRPEGPRIAGVPRPWLALAAALGLATLLLTHSRMLWLAMPVGLGLWILWNLPRRAALVATSLIVVAVAVGSRSELVRFRFHDSYGATTRMELWRANLHFFAERPATGVGWLKNEPLSYYYLTSIHPGEDIFAGHAHDNFLDFLAGTGALGTLAWLAWCLGTLGFLGRAAFRRDPVSFSRGLFCAWVVFHLNGITQRNFWEAKVDHQMMIAVAWALLWAGELRPSSEPRIS